LHDKCYVANVVLDQNNFPLQQKSCKELYQFLRLDTLQEKVKRVILQLESERLEIAELEKGDVLVCLGLLLSVQTTEVGPLDSACIAAASEHVLIRGGIGQNYLDVPVYRGVEVEMLAEDRDVQLKDGREVHDWKRLDVLTKFNSTW
jgi:hypothetical protein